MLGLFERIGAGLEMAGLAVEGVVINAKCAASNLAADVKIARAQRSSGGVYDDEEDINDTEEFDGEETVSAEQAEAYEKMFKEIVQHEEFCKRNPSEIGVELGYSEEEVKECFAFAQEKMESNNNMYNHFGVKKAFYGRTGFARALGVLTTKDEEEDKEQIIDVYCPKCGEKRTITPNTGFTCKGCGVRISVGDEGEIRCSI
ncbi:MAG: hypothetical protein IJA54_06745 [Tyzzerella sp.]|nr:hypothetical protein [Tyzzerella sp.]